MRIDFPIVARELQIAARSVRTFQLRQSVAAVALAVFFLIFQVAQAGGFGRTQMIVVELARLAFIYSALAGVILAADSISAEKREGTLGLLFLTRLKGIDIVGGALAATSFRAAYGLLAAMPVLGITLMLGGLELTEFMRIGAVLFSTIVLSMALSIFVSCCSRKHSSAAARALLGMGVIVVGIPLLGSFLRRTWSGYATGWTWYLNLLSPVTALDLSRGSLARNRADFWISLLEINSLSIMLFAGAAIVVSRVWRDRTSAALLSRAFLARAWNQLATAVNRALRPRLRGQNPFAWLAAATSPGPVRLAIAALFLAAGGTFLAVRFLTPAIVARGPGVQALLIVWAWLSVILYACFAFSLASFATKRFVEDRHSGALELMLVTPLRTRTILAGNLRAMAGRLGGPAMVVLFVHAIVLLGILFFAGIENDIPGNGWQVLQVLARSGAENLQNWIVKTLLAAAALSAMLMCVNWVALALTGMWIGMRAKHPAAAVWLTLALVFIPPVVVWAVTVMIGGWLGMPASFSFWIKFCVIMGAVLILLNAAVLIAISSVQLTRNFRAMAASRYERAPRRLCLPSRRVLLRTVVVLGSINLIILGSYLEELWRGRHSWNALVRRHAARGELLTRRLQAPREIPEAENFGAGAIFKPLFDFSFAATGEAVWRDPNAKNLLLALTVCGVEKYQWKPVAGAPAANWALGHSLDLDAWAKFYRGSAAFSVQNGLSSAETVLEALRLFAPELNQIEQLARRPHSRFPIHYRDGWAGFSLHQWLLQNIAEIFQLRAAAELELGRNDAALADIGMSIRLADFLRDEPGLNARRIRNDILVATIQPLWDGLAAGRWREADLCALQVLFQRDVLASYSRAISDQALLTGEFWNHYPGPDTSLLPRWGFPAGFRFLAPLYPRGWSCLNQAGLVRLADDRLNPLIDAPAHRVYPSRSAGLSEAIQTCGVSIDPVFHLLIHYALPNFLDAPAEFAHAQVSLDQAVIACALERHRLKHGSYPARLRDLDPAILAKAPFDPITGQNYIYTRGEQRFRLYSCGWNGADDHGHPAVSNPVLLQQNIREGDWVWGCPMSKNQ